MLGQKKSSFLFLYTDLAIVLYKFLTQEAAQHIFSLDSLSDLPER